jgi:hypothetical protein
MGVAAIYARNRDIVPWFTFYDELGPMRIILNYKNMLHHSYYSDTFLIAGHVYKIFKRYGDEQFDARSLALFRAQCHAYGKAAANPILKRHIPGFFGEQNIVAVIDKEGNDISSMYDLNRCYRIEKIEGNEEKVSDKRILDFFPHVAVMRKLFMAEGIDTSDAIVIRYEHPDLFKFTDFKSASL